MKLFDQIKNAGIPFEHWESDLIVKNCDALWTILEDHPVDKNNSSVFKDEDTGEFWVEIPFGYSPWWDEHMKLEREE